MCNCIVCVVHFKLGEIPTGDSDIPMFDVPSSNLAFLIVIAVTTAFIICLLVAIGCVAILLCRRRTKENANVNRHTR